MNSSLGRKVHTETVGYAALWLGVVVLIVLSQILSMRSVRAQEASSIVFAASCFEVVSSEMTSGQETVAQIKLTGTLLGTATDGKLLVLVSPECLTQAAPRQPPHDGDRKDPDDDALAGADSAAAREAIDDVSRELIANGADPQAIQRGADSLRNFVAKHEGEGDLTEPLADAAQRTSSTGGGAEAAAMAAMVAACLAVSGGTACALPAALGAVIAFGTDVSSEDFQSGIEIMSKVTAGQSLDEDDYTYLKKVGVPDWARKGIPVIQNRKVGGYLNAVADNAVNSNLITKTHLDVFIQLGILVDTRGSITCDDVFETAKKANTGAITVDARTRRAIDLALVYATGGLPPMEAKELLDCLDDAFPSE